MSSSRLASWCSILKPSVITKCELLVWANRLHMLLLSSRKFLYDLVLSVFLWHYRCFAEDTTFILQGGFKTPWMNAGKEGEKQLRFSILVSYLCIELASRMSPRWNNWGKILGRSMHLTEKSIRIRAFAPLLIILNDPEFRRKLCFEQMCLT